MLNQSNGWPAGGLKYCSETCSAEDAHDTKRLKDKDPGSASAEQSDTAGRPEKSFTSA